MNDWLLHLAWRRDLDRLRTLGWALLALSFAIMDVSMIIEMVW